MSNRLPEEVRIKACQLFSLGYGYKNVAKVLNLNVYTVRDWKRDYASMSRSSRTINPVGRRPEDKADIVRENRRIFQMLVQEESIRHIAEVMNLSEATIRRRLRQMQADLFPR